MFAHPPPPPFEAPYYATVAYDEQVTKETEEQKPNLILYGRDTVYDTENDVVIFKLDNPLEVFMKIKHHESEDLLLLRKEDSISPPEDCPSFDLKPQNVRVGYLGLLRGYITLTTSDVSKEEATPILDKQCAKIKTQAVRSILEREGKIKKKRRVNP